MATELAPGTRAEEASDRGEGAPSPHHGRTSDLSITSPPLQIYRIAR
jgi:hypothetical protein